MNKKILETDLGTKLSLYFKKINEISDKNIWTFSFDIIENKGDVFNIFNKIQENVIDKIKKDKIDTLLIYVQSEKKYLNKKTKVFTRWIENLDFVENYKVSENGLLVRRRKIKSVNTNIIEVNINKNLI